MNVTSLAVLVTVLLIAAAMAEIKTGVRYSCPACGSNRVDGHSPECPWGPKP